MKKVKSIYNYTFNFTENTHSELPEGNKNGTDNEKCQYFQAQFLQTGNEKFFVFLWQFFTVLCKRAVKKEMRIKRFYLDEDEIQYKADIACEYTLRRYQNYKAEGKTYFISNFISAAYHGAKHALYSETENDLFLSFCKELDGKPLRELSKRSAKYAGSFVQNTKGANNNEDVDKGQLLLF